MEEKQKKEAKTRTSITIDPVVLEATKKHCEAVDVSVSSFIESCLRAATLSSQPAVVEESVVEPVETV